MFNVFLYFIIIGITVFLCYLCFSYKQKEKFLKERMETVSGKILLNVIIHDIKTLEELYFPIYRYSIGGKIFYKINDIPYHENKTGSVIIKYVINHPKYSYIGNLGKPSLNTTFNMLLIASIISICISILTIILCIL